MVFVVVVVVVVNYFCDLALTIVSFPAERKYFIIQEMEPSGRRSIFRQFYREEATGCIIEIFKVSLLPLCVYIQFLRFSTR